MSTKSLRVSLFKHHKDLERKMISLTSRKNAIKIKLKYKLKESQQGTRTSKTDIEN